MQIGDNIEKTIVYIFGDSHCTIFLNAESSKFKAIVSGYDGASISGLNETTSRLEYGKYMMDIIVNRSPSYYYLLKFKRHLNYSIFYN